MHACIVLLVYHANRRVALASTNMNVFKTRFIIKLHLFHAFCGCATSVLLNSLANIYFGNVY